MKNKLLILSVLILAAGCTKKTGPDESIIVQGDSLRLPPEYILKAPDEVKTIKEEEKSVDSKSQEILLKGEVKEDKDVNTWLMDNAGGQDRVKNIKTILDDDIKKENSK